MYRRPLPPRYLFAAFAAMTVACALPVLAGAQPRGGQRMGPPKCLPPGIKVLVPKYDTNKNGKLERNEMRALHRDKRAAALKKYDKDNDGKLSAKERANLRHGKMVEHFEELDRNRDAEISKAEANGSCTPIEHFFGRIDSDNDGKITWTEFAAAAKKFRPPGHRHGRRPPPHHAGGARP